MGNGQVQLQGERAKEPASLQAQPAMPEAQPTRPEAEPTRLEPQLGMLQVHTDHTLDGKSARRAGDADFKFGTVKLVANCS